MEINSDKYENIEVTDVDFVFGQGDVYSITLKPGDYISRPAHGLGAPGSYTIELADGETQEINAMSVQCVSSRKRKMSVLKKVKTDDKA